MSVQAFVAEAAIERFHERIAGRLARPAAKEQLSAEHRTF
jgi:hypothetical protein